MPRRARPFIPSTCCSWYVYILIDPRSGEVRYVGSTGQIKCRLKAHFNWSASESASSSPVGVWLAELKALGLRPVMRVEASVSCTKRRDAKNFGRALEKFNVRFYATRAQNEPLLNVQYNPCFGYTKATAPYREHRCGLIKYRNMTYSAAEWANRLGISRQAFHQRCKKHGPVQAIRMGMNKQKQS